MTGLEAVPQDCKITLYSNVVFTTSQIPTSNAIYNRKCKVLTTAKSTISQCTTAAKTYKIKQTNKQKKSKIVTNLS